MEDFFLLDQELHDEERLARDRVRAFVDKEVIPIMGDAVEEARFPFHLVSRFVDLGLLGPTLPPAFGGSSANYVTYGLICQELERGDSALRSFISVQGALVMYPILTYGSQTQKENFLLRLARGELIGCFALTEPEAGSDPSSIKTFAKKVVGGWRLNGTKLWVTNGPIADLAIVWAQTEQGIRGFIVEKTFTGFQAHEIKKKLSLRASISGGLKFDDCFVPDSHYLPGSDKGLGAALSCLTQARYGIAWGAMGAAMACYEIAVNYCKERNQFKQPIASFQLVQKALSEMLIEIVKAQCLNLRLGRLKDKGQSSFEMVSLAKLNACREALEIARQARNLLGANGIRLEYSVIRHVTNLESVFTYEGTDNMHHLILGKHITGLDAFH